MKIIDFFELDVETRKLTINGKNVSPAKSLRHRSHSPTGFMWGYLGSGPAQLALAILLEVLPEEEALEHYQDFKNEVISSLDQNSSCRVDGDVVHSWLETKVRGGGSRSRIMRPAHV